MRVIASTHLTITGYSSSNALRYESTTGLAGASTLDGRAVAHGVGSTTCGRPASRRTSSASQQLQVVGHSHSIVAGGLHEMS